jgi:hypothetical protein
MGDTLAVGAQVAEGMAGSKRLASSRITGQQLQVDAHMVSKHAIDNSACS